MDIVIKGAREHNLKDLNLTLPSKRFIVITGPSGCGKSSLAIDTLFTEGQNRYIESLSPYARQFFSRRRRPAIDFAEGLPPSIAIEQSRIYRGHRSTVGTITEIYDYLRLLYARAGTVYCLECKRPAISRDIRDVMASVKTFPDGTRLQVLAPIIRERKGDHKKEIAAMRSEGFLRARVNGEIVDISEGIELERNRRNTVEVVIDRLIIDGSIHRRLMAAVDSGLRFCNSVIINLLDDGVDLILSKTLACPICGKGFNDYTPMSFSFNSGLGCCKICAGVGYEPDGAICSQCRGKRLNHEALSVLIDGIDIIELSRLTINNAKGFLDSLRLDETIAGRILKTIGERLGFIADVGLDYLTLDRAASTLSGGEAQRARLAAQLGSGLTGVLYVMDEPSIGLHPSDCSRLLDMLEKIRDNGNTVIVVEHDPETMLRADLIFDMGHGAGRDGGRIIAKGSPEEIMADKSSVTGRYLTGEFIIPFPMERRRPSVKLNITGVTEHNLKDITIDIPLEVFIAVTGVSGCGKSTLILDVLYPAIYNLLHGRVVKSVGRHGGITGIEHLERVIAVDQSQIGRSPRSNTVTYIGIYKYIRDIFAATVDARACGYGPSRFSFNIIGGRCEFCMGGGIKRYDMRLLPQAEVRCDECLGTRFNRETLYIEYKGRNISDVLSMTVTEGLEFFGAIPRLNNGLKMLAEVGLGYLLLGQNVDTLSGGEAQRLRLARELYIGSGGKKTLYIFDEPTTGLHFVDIERLLSVIQRLVDIGNTVIVIEHNLDMIKSADYIIDLGPAGGEKGGYLIAAGTPEEVVDNPASLTGRYLKDKVS